MMTMKRERPAAKPSVGDQMLQLMEELFPLHRSLLGEGLDLTLQRLARELPLDLLEVRSGTRVFDWVVPDAWQIRGATIRDTSGRVLVDYRHSNLHVVSFSRSVQRRMKWSELAAHLHTDPAHPDWVPYRASFFRDTWGFCLSHRQWLRLAENPEAEFDVEIDAERQSGAMTLGELVIPGESTEETLFYAHTCHPSLANDNLSGIAVATYLARGLLERPRRRWTYRFVFAPATLGAIAWLSLRQPILSRIRQGLVLSLLGDGQPFSYKQSEQGDASIDQVVGHWMRERELAHRVHPFEPWGYDERQFNAPGFRLPVGRLTRSLPGGYPEYHTSADSLELVRSDSLAESLAACQQIVELLEDNLVYRNESPYGEPRLGDRGLYRGYGEDSQRGQFQQALLWTLNQSNGQRPLLSIAQRAGLPFAMIREAARVLESEGLLSVELPHRRTPGGDAASVPSISSPQANTHPC